MTYERKALAWLTFFALFLAFVWLLSDILLPFVVGLIIAYFLDPIADRLCRAGMSRVIATTLIMVVMIVLILFLFLFLVPLIASEIRDLIAGIPDQLQAMRSALEDLARRWFGDKFPVFQAELERTVADWSKDWSSYATGVLKSIWSGGLAVVNFLSLIL
ncbi:MAG: AI-2E family transporter, partial [Hyphomicrobiaceae bacterium]